MALLACGLGMLLIYGVAMARFPLLRTYKTQILTLEQQAMGDPRLGPLLALACGLLFLLYAGGYAALRGLDRAPGPLIALVALPPLLAAAMLLLTHPTSSLDLYDYLYRGHVAARYGANNFIQSPEDFKAIDRLYWYTAWRRATTAYGPLWEALSIVVAQLAGTKLLGLLLGFKLTSALGWLLCGAAIWWAGQPGQRLLGLYLWLWNPLVLWELVGAGHNDGWMLCCGLLAFGLLGRRPTLALLLITLGALFKYPLALLWPLLLLAALAGTPTWQTRLSLLLRAGLLCALLGTLAYLPWWAGPAMLDQLRDRVELFANSPLALLRAIWLPTSTKDVLDPQLMLVGLGALVLGLLVAAWRAWRSPQQIVSTSAGLLAWFLVAGSAWFQPWYLSWLVGLLALRPALLRGHATLGALSLGALLLYPAASALRPLLGWPGDGVAWQALVLLLLYLPPLIAGIAWRRRPAAAPATPAPPHPSYAQEALP
jgi:hypothetical protein